MLRQIKAMIKMFWTLKEVILLYFKQDSSLVRSHAILILAGMITFDEVQDFLNLRQAVAEYLGIEYKE